MRILLLPKSCLNLNLDYNDKGTKTNAMTYTYVHKRTITKQLYTYKHNYAYAVTNETRNNKHDDIQHNRHNDKKNDIDTVWYIRRMTHTYTNNDTKSSKKIL